MPDCGSQIILCDLPVRFDTYRGCGHACRYCFARRWNDIASIQPAESPDTLRRWIAGKRTTVTAWCDWKLPLHWGGMSDPFQPADHKYGRSLSCLRIFADTGYPVVISTKGALLGTRAYYNVLAHCNACVQVSLVCRAYDKLEPGAPRFGQRLRLIRRLVPRARRVIVRVQPYQTEYLADVLEVLPRYADAGVHGITVEGLKCRHKVPGTVAVGGDFVLPTELLKPDYLRLRARCHELGLRFYCAENRLRRLGDSRCCCGVDGLAGFQPNRANLNSLAHHRPIRYRRRMHQRGTAKCFQSIAQNAVATHALKTLSFAEVMDMAAESPVFREVMGLPALRVAVDPGVDAPDYDEYNNGPQPLICPATGDPYGGA